MTDEQLEWIREWAENGLEQTSAEIEKSRNRFIPNRVWFTLVVASDMFKRIRAQFPSERALETSDDFDEPEQETPAIRVVVRVPDWLTEERRKAYEERIFQQAVEWVRLEEQMKGMLSPTDQPYDHEQAMAQAREEFGKTDLRAGPSFPVYLSRVPAPAREDIPIEKTTDQFETYEPPLVMTQNHAGAEAIRRFVDSTHTDAASIHEPSPDVPNEPSGGDDA